MQCLQYHDLVNECSFRFVRGSQHEAEDQAVLSHLFLKLYQCLCNPVYNCYVLNVSNVIQ